MSEPHKLERVQSINFDREVSANSYLKMHSFYKENKFCDVVLVAGNDNTRVPAHRLVLCASSEHFAELLDPLPSGEVVLEGIDGDALLALMDFIYTSKLQLTPDNVEGIMQTASRLGIDIVVTECCDFLAENVSIENCVSLLVFSEQQAYLELREKVLMYACEAFEELVKEESFLQLDAELLCRLIRRNDLCAQSEEDVFHAMMSWVQHDTVNRDKFTYELLCHLRLPLLKPEFIAKEVEEVCKSPESQGLLIKAFKWHMSPTSRSVFSRELCAPRNQKRQVILLKGGTKQEGRIIAELFDPLYSEWSTKNWPPKPKSGWYSSGLLVNDKVYLAGTTVQQGTEISCVDCFDLDTWQWIELPPMATHRFSFGMAELDGVLYAVGGTQLGTDSLSIVEKWDPNSPMNWQEVTPMQAARSQPAVTVLNGLVYAIGSNSDFGDNTFEFYDPQTNTWAELTPPSEARTSLGLTAVRGYLYAVGGRTRGGICSMVERYDPKTDSWMEISPSGRYEQYQQCTVSLDRLIVLVEHNLARSVHVIEEYNPETERWRTLNPLERHSGTLILIS